jgi:hypothetical protein
VGISYILSDDVDEVVMLKFGILLVDSRATLACCFATSSMIEIMRCLSFSLPIWKFGRLKKAETSLVQISNPLRSSALPSDNSLCICTKSYFNPEAELYLSSGFLLVIFVMTCDNTSGRSDRFEDTGGMRRDRTFCMIARGLSPENAGSAVSIIQKSTPSE